MRDSRTADRYLGSLCDCEGGGSEKLLGPLPHFDVVSQLQPVQAALYAGAITGISPTTGFSTKAFALDKFNAIYLVADVNQFTRHKVAVEWLSWPRNVDE